MSELTGCYVGYCRGCGHLCAATVDEPEYQRETAKFVADMVRQGMRVERATVGQVRKSLEFCTCKRRSEKSSAQQELSLAATTQETP